VNSPESSAYRGPRQAPWVTKKDRVTRSESELAFCRGLSRGKESFSVVRVVPALVPAFASPLSKQTGGPDIAYQTSIGHDRHGHDARPA
jgi:hypothetical protein